MARLLQANLNHARRAQDLFLHTMAERDVGLGVVTEPYQVPANHPGCVVDKAGSVAIKWRGTRGSSMWSTLEREYGLVAVKWGRVVVMAVYLPPSLNRAQFEHRLDRISICITRYRTEPVILAGDFNAKSAVWGSRRPDYKGGILVDWAAQNNLTLLNEGNTSTCVSRRGESIVDLTWATPLAAHLVSGWRVMEELESLSDHLYIEMKISVASRE